MDLEDVLLYKEQEQFLNYIQENDAAGCKAMIQEQEFDINCFLILSRHPISDLTYRTQPLNTACIFRFPNIITLLLQTGGANPNSRDEFGYSPIHLAIYDWPHYLYAKNNLNLDFRTGKISLQNYRSILHENSLPCVKLLCDAGADINLHVADGQRDTALHLAAKENFTDCLNLLVKYDVDLNVQDVDGKTPLMVAADCEHIKIVKELTKNGADVNSRDKDNMTVLHLVCRCHSPDYPHTHLVKFLLKSGADVNAQNIYGNTPLHIASAWGYESIIDWLLVFGANPNILNRSRQSALYLLLNILPLENKLPGVHKLLNEMSQIYIHDINSLLPWHLYLPEMAGLRQILVQASTRPSSLQRFCRQVIRRTVGIQDLGLFLETLQYPTSLKHFIFFENFNMF